MVLGDALLDRVPVGPRVDDAPHRVGDLRTQLKRPLGATMTTKPPKIDALTGAEAKRIDDLTYSNLFTYEHIQQQDGSIYLVLDRPS